MIAKNIMTRDIITVTPTMTVKTLAMTLIKNQIKWCPGVQQGRQDRGHRVRNRYRRQEG